MNTCDHHTTTHEGRMWACVLAPHPDQPDRHYYRAAQEDST